MITPAVVPCNHSDHATGRVCRLKDIGRLCGHPRNWCHAPQDAGTE